MKGLLRFIAIILVAGLISSQTGSGFIVVAGLVLLVASVTLLIRPAKSGWFQHRSSSAALLVSAFILLASDWTFEPSPTITDRGEPTPTPAKVNQQYTTFKTEDFFWDDSTRPYEALIVEGVNRLHRQNPDCAKINPGTLGRSTTRGSDSNPSFFIACGEGYNAFIYHISKEAIEKNANLGPMPNLKRSEAIALCEKYARSVATNPGTVDFSKLIGLSIKEFPNGNSRVDSTFTAENQLGMKVKFEVSCLVTLGGSVEGVHSQVAN